MIKVNGKVVDFKKFGNGEMELMHKSIVRGTQLASPEVHFKYEDDSDLVKLLFVKDYIDSLYVTSSHLTIYYMPYSRMDRVENGSAFTLKSVANFINARKFPRVTVIEPHSDVTPALLDNVKALYINFDLIEKVMEEVGFDQDKDYLMFPDAGAAKRYSMMNALNILVASKERNFVTHRIDKLTVQAPKESVAGRKVIIVDDLSSYGGTFDKSGKALEQLGFSEVYLLVAHAEKTILDGVLLLPDSPIDKVFTTNTIVDEIDVLTKASELDQPIDRKIKIYDIEGVLSNDKN